MIEKKIRGYFPDDDHSFCKEEVGKLRQAQEELQFLVDRGYSMQSAVTFVGNHHQLTTRQRLALIRSASSSEHLKIRRDRQLNPEEMKDQRVYIDGFNLIITLEAALAGGMLFVGQDSCIRDLAELRGSYRMIEQTERAILLIRDALTLLNVSSAVFYLDQPVSNSGQLKGKIDEVRWPMPAEVELVRNPDALLKKLPCVVTSDSIILNEAERWFNLTAYILTQYHVQVNHDRWIDLSMAQSSQRNVIFRW